MRLIAVLFAASAAEKPFVLPDGVALDRPLRAADAVSIALLNNTSLDAELASLGLAKADLTDAKLMRNPLLQTLLPVGGKPFEFLLIWPIEELWQRKKRVLAAEKNLAAVEKGLGQVRLNLIRDVRVAHAELHLAQRRTAELEETERWLEKITAMVEKRVDAGDATGVELVRARTDVAVTREARLRSFEDTRTAEIRLRNLLGVRQLGAALSASAPAYTSNVAVNFDADQAYTNRPDLRAAEIAVEVATLRAKWQRSRILNSLAPLFSAKETGSPQQLRAGPGLQIELPLLNKNQGQIARADAEVIQAARRYLAARDRVELEVFEAASRLHQARTALQELREKLLPAVEAGVALVQKAHANGDATGLQELDASRPIFDLRLRVLDAEGAVMRAEAELDRAMGRMP